MKTTTEKKGGGKIFYSKLLLLCSWLMLTGFSARAQGGISGGTAIGSAVLNADGYSIDGDDMPVLYKEYTYTRTMPEATGVYWHPEGAETINGVAASIYPEGSLAATEYAVLLPKNWTV